MISYTLRCANGHAFDGWFRGSDDFESQLASGLLTCPVCGDATLSKALMAPNVSTARSKEQAAQEVHRAMVAAKAAMEVESSPGKAVDGEVLPAGAAIGAMPSLKDAPAPVKAYVEAVRKLRAEVEAHSEDVGTRFVEEARRMHHGEIEERPIRGQASLEEAAALDEEGIDVFVIPPLPEDGH
jgi:hypothetical protein